MAAWISAMVASCTSNAGGACAEGAAANAASARASNPAASHVRRVRVAVSAVSHVGAYHRSAASSAA